MGEEFVGQDGGVCVNFDEVDCQCWDLGEHYPTEAVGEGEGDGGEDEVYGCFCGLDRLVLGFVVRSMREGYVAYFDLGTARLITVDGTVVHDGRVGQELLLQ